jgi:ABC-2 type transport system permease protein
MTAHDLTSEPTGTPAPAGRATEFTKFRLFGWSVRRELWEHSSIYYGPIVVALVMLLGFALGVTRLVDMLRTMFVFGEPTQAGLLLKPLALTAVPIVAAASLAAMYYCLDALHGERRDRSILFWKSLPVSDVMTVAAKASIPLLVVPVVACATVIAFHLLVLALGTGVLIANGMGGAFLWQGASLPQLWGAVIYWIVGLAIWHAPIYAWFMLVSAWAKRGTFLWSVLPPLGIALVERIAFGTNYVGPWLKHRFFGLFDYGVGRDLHGFVVPDPTAVLGDPDLWIGLVVAAALLAAAVWLRRYRQPI